VLQKGELRHYRLNIAIHPAYPQHLRRGRSQVEPAPSQDAVVPIVIAIILRRDEEECFAVPPVERRIDSCREAAPIVRDRSIGGQVVGVDGISLGVVAAVLIAVEKVELAHGIMPNVYTNGFGRQRRGDE